MKSSKRAKVKAQAKPKARPKAKTTPRAKQPAKPARRAVLLKKPASKKPASAVAVRATRSIEGATVPVTVAPDQPLGQFALDQPRQSFTVLALSFVDTGTLTYKVVGVYETVIAASAQVQALFKKWRENVAQPFCEREVRNTPNLDTEEERQDALRRVIKGSMRVKVHNTNGCVCISASLDGCGRNGASIYHQWQALPGVVPDPDAWAREFYRDLVNQGLLQGARLGAPDPRPA